MLKKYFNFGHHEAHVFREFPLGTSYRADYLIAGKNSDGWHFVYVELEAPNGSITLTNGELGATFRKGQIQTTDWQTWLDSNFHSLHEFFSKHTKQDEQLPIEFRNFDRTRISYVVIAGRRKDFQENTYRIQRQTIQNAQTYLIHYDNVIDAVRQLVDSRTY